MQSQLLCLPIKLLAPLIKKRINNLINIICTVIYYSRLKNDIKCFIISG